MASAVYSRELLATQNAGAYLILCVGFPIIGIVMGFLGRGHSRNPPDRGRLADADAMA